MFAIERDGHVATVWLDRAEKLNAMGPEFWSGLPAVMDDLGDDPAVRAVVVAGRGRAFSVGIDLSHYGPLLAGSTGERPASPVVRRRELLGFIKELQGAITAVAECPKPVIAAVHGYCLGGGVDLITACDIRLASEDATFSVRETRLAMVADVGTLQRLPRIVDAGRVAELVFTGRDITAAEALEMGLVGRVYPTPEALWKEAAGLAAAIAANSPLAVQGAKQVLRATADLSVDEGLDYVALWNAAFLESADLTEAIRALAEKRTPRFQAE